MGDLPGERETSVDDVDDEGRRHGGADGHALACAAVVRGGGAGLGGVCEAGMPDGGGAVRTTAIALVLAVLGLLGLFGVLLGLDCGRRARERRRRAKR